MSTDMRRPQRLSLTQQCAESMKQHIMRGALKPGDRLPTEQEWVEMLGVSRLVVREALQVLAGIGLIDVQQGRGAFVRDSTRISVFDQLTFGLDLQQLTYTDVLEARAMLDLAVLELCMLRADQQALDEMEELLRLMQRAVEAGEPEHEYHRAFHRRMQHAAGNPLIERIGAALLDTFWRIGDSVPGLIYPTTHAEGYDQIESHRMLLDAIKSRDLSRSRELVVKHLPVQSGVSYVFPIVSSPAVSDQGRHDR
jgi:GntR family transcriptional regulator, transcriptional repressor for pyruvate dehydrogenase complex